MSKAILEFNLPDDNNEFLKAINANSLYRALRSIKYDVIRPRIKYIEYDKNTKNVIECIYREICDIIGDLLEYSNE